MTSPAGHSQIAPPVIWTAEGAFRDLTQQWQWMSGVWIPASSHGAIWGQNIRMLAIALSPIAPGMTTLEAILSASSDHSLRCHQPEDGDRLGA